VSARFERRFAGPANAGLRAQIREVVARLPSTDYEGAEVEAAILSLRRTVALQAWGLDCLRSVAADYREAYLDRQRERATVRGVKVGAGWA
jgi:hypothetical protein